MSERLFSLIEETPQPTEDGCFGTSYAPTPFVDALPHPGLCPRYRLDAIASHGRYFLIITDMAAPHGKSLRVGRPFRHFHIFRRHWLRETERLSRAPVTCSR